MLVAAAMDLGAHQKETVDAMLSAKKHLKGCSRLEISVKDVVKHGFKAKQVSVETLETVHERNADEMIGALRDALSSLSPSKAARNFAIKSLETLAGVEGKLHNEKPNKVHLHEAGSVDTLVDILGTTYALDDLGIFSDTRVKCTNSKN